MLGGASRAVTKLDGHTASLASIDVQLSGRPTWSHAGSLRDGRRRCQRCQPGAQRQAGSGAGLAGPVVSSSAAWRAGGSGPCRRPGRWAGSACPGRGEHGAGPVLARWSSEVRRVAKGHWPAGWGPSPARVNHGAASVSAARRGGLRGPAGGEGQAGERPSPAWGIMAGFRRPWRCGTAACGIALGWHASLGLAWAT